MADVFITDIQETAGAKETLSVLESRFPELHFHFDGEDSAYRFPCGHTILRVEGAILNPEEIRTIVNSPGFRCDVLEDKICK